MVSTQQSIAKRPIAVFVIAVGLFVLIELAVQVRAQMKYGYNLFATMENESMFVVDGSTGLKLLRPSGVFVRNQQFIRSNSLGLRGPEISMTHGPQTRRIAILGASTVMGATAPDNEHTFPALLESRLRTRLRGLDVEVINAGISGYALADEQAMLERRLAPLRPDLVVLYPGFNDFGPYCQPTSRHRAPALKGLPTVALPEWWMSDDLVLENTKPFRWAPPAFAGNKDAATMDLSAFRASVVSLIGSARSRGEFLIVATVARSFRRQQDQQVQEKLSAYIRSLLPCFSLDGMHQLFDRHNEVLKAEARAAHVPVLELDRIIPGGDHYFSNTTHFAEAGEQAAADALADFISDNHFLDSGPNH